MLGRAFALVVPTDRRTRRKSVFTSGWMRRMPACSWSPQQPWTPNCRAAFHPEAAGEQHNCDLPPGKTSENVSLFRLCWQFMIKYKLKHDEPVT